MTHAGEFSHELFELIEWMAAKIKQHTKNNPRDDGLSPAKVTAAWRTKVKDGLATAMAEGWGYQLISAGLPKASDINYRRVGLSSSRY